MHQDEHVIVICQLYFHNMIPQIELSINFNVLFKVQSHRGNGLRTLLDNNINTLIKQSDTDITELSYSKN